ncbi:DUF2079 domain-containing protein [Candidatus Microgenomates bacterium]|nr:DUF2079 domain-containing protein [Candidatus Microgenomates bacterium]
MGVQRYRTLYASYYDLGIMHQTVYNTFRAIQTLDFSRILEMTNTESPQQITRMAIHNDVLLAFLAPFYFIYASPITLIILQTLALAAGAIVIYYLCLEVFKKSAIAPIVGALFSLVWLLYPPMQRSNLYDFHAVVLSTTFLLGMYYLWVKKRYRWSGLFFVLSILSKEQVALTTLLFGVYALMRPVHVSLLSNPVRDTLKRIHSDKKNFMFSVLVIAASAIWFILSIFVIIPYFRGADHFAAARYGEFGESPGAIIWGIFHSPMTVVHSLIKNDAIRYVELLLGPLGYLSLFSPLHLLIVVPEFAINLLSNSPAMRNIIYHYTAVIQPFLFIAAIYGLKNVLSWIKRLPWIPASAGMTAKNTGRDSGRILSILCIFLLVMTMWYSYTKSPLIYSREREIHPFVYPQKEWVRAEYWAKQVQDETTTVSTTGQLAPYFTSRRYFYTFSKYYSQAQYVIIRPNEIYDYTEKAELVPVYERLVKDSRYRLVEKQDNFEVYKRI